VTLILVQNLGLGLVAAQTVAERCFDDNFVKNGSVVQGDSESVGNGALAGIVVVQGELGVLNTADALAEVLDKRRGGSLGAISVIFGRQAVEGEHGRNHVLETISIYYYVCAEIAYLNAVVTVGKVVHGLKLLVDDADTSFVSAVGDFLDVRGGLAERLKLLVDDLSGLNCGLRVEFSYSIVKCLHETHWKTDLPG